MRIDQKEHINKIDDEVIAEIRRSRTGTSIKYRSRGLRAPPQPKQALENSDVFEGFLILRNE